MLCIPLAEIKTMKRFFVAVVLLATFSACENQGSSTVGTYEYDDDLSAVEMKMSEPHEHDVIMPDTTAGHTDTLHKM